MKGIIERIVEIPSKYIECQSNKLRHPDFKTGLHFQELPEFHSFRSFVLPLLQQMSKVSQDKMFISFTAGNKQAFFLAPVGIEPVISDVEVQCLNQYAVRTKSLYMYVQPPFQGIARIPRSYISNNHAFILVPAGFEPVISDLTTLTVTPSGFGVFMCTLSFHFQELTELHAFRSFVLPLLKQLFKVSQDLLHI